ncbi:SusC/RagA family TonB-linked outer membrane protein [Parapedobacter sp. ISTM3]|uniref:SusC/RagA family TonB-linked outer membrane protein n=1 Tax=Parapedobacter sp. ISTM3 TaxID=2800130 RepID=UPI00190304D2|nr:SusC/RagA family TonB-linked outer membrane protein [Parapedobacter sp. ISTM3]MBK1438876.1 SusC/RagA family TonB-linked outer membrane protein [Parapedobacter sp. ISTM3]
MSRLLLLLVAISCTATGVISASDAMSQDLRKINVMLAHDDNSNLGHIFQKLEQQSGLRFYYDKAVGEMPADRFADAGKANLYDLLVTISNNYNLKITQNKNIIAVAKARMQQPSRISGRVTDAEGIPLSGANVRIVEIDRTVSTDENGNFSINVQPASYTVEVSYIAHLGQRTENVQVEAGKTTLLNFELETTAESLEEVVVVGYGNASSKEISGSIASLPADKINKGPVTSVGQMLQGRAAGVVITRDGNPNGSPSITIRGTSTLRSGGMNVLYVVDGIPMQEGAVMPAPNDIIAIDILKDASAAAIYGSRAANGVILITTRQGQKGEGKYINVDSWVNIETVAKRYEMMNADEYRKYVQDAGAAIVEGWDHGVDTDWQKEVMRTAQSHNQYLNLGGVSGGTKYDASVNFLSRNGLIKTSGVQRITARANVDQSILNDRISIGLTLNGSIADSDPIYNQGTFLRSMLTFVPTINAQDENGVYMEDPSRRDFNPMAMLEQVNIDSRDEKLLGSIRAKASIIKGLDYNLHLSYQTSRNSYGSYAMKDYLPEYTRNGEAERSTSTMNSLVFENYFSYNTQIDRHRIGAMAGYSWQEDNTGDGFQTTNVNFVSDATGYYNMNLGAPPAGYLVDYGNYAIKTLRMISFYGRVNYNFDQRYILQASLRRDGSSAFGRDSRWGFFPSVSGAWRIISERFMENQSIFDDLKLKVGWGISGNSHGFDPMISRLRYGTSGRFYDAGTFQTGIVPVQNENPDLKWEKTSMINVGMDMAFFNSRLILGVEYYNKLTSDLIWNYSVPLTEYLYGSMTANVGKIRNDGIEATLTATPVSTNIFQWNTTLTMAHNRNEVVSLSNDKFAIDNDIRRGPAGAGQSGGSSLIIREGYPLGTLFTHRFAGFEYEDGSTTRGHSLFYDKDGNITAVPTDVTDYHLLGNTQPKLTFGWNHNLSYKNWSLDLMFTGVLGHKVLNATLARLTYVSRTTHFNQPKYVLESGQPFGDTRSQFMSDRYIENADHLRLQNASLAYTFGIKPAAGVRTISIYANVNNAFVITKYRGIDPEVNMGGIDPGVDNNNFYPMPRAFQIGAKLGF